MNKKLFTLKLLIDPFPFICFCNAIILLFGNIIFLISYNQIYDPLLLWGTLSALIYIAAATLLKRQHSFYLFLFYIIESCLRVAFFMLYMKCDAKYEILLISFFVNCFFFAPENKKHPHLFIFAILFILLTIIHTFFFKYSYYRPVEFLTREQSLFTRVIVFSNIILTCLQLIIISFSTSLSLRKMHMRNEATTKKLEYITCHDILTGLMNRYLALYWFNNCESRKKNESIEYAIAILDIDDFKKINDIYGHDCGDFALKSYTQELRRKLPPQIQIARWGGEEFVIIFPKITSETIFDLDTIRELLSLTPFYYNGQIIHITATYGMSSSKRFSSAIEVLNDADANLLVGKQNGKNRLVVSQKF